MTEYENLLKKQYEQQLQAGRNAVEGSVRQAEGALTQYAQQREDEARQAYVRMKQAETELKEQLAEVLGTLTEREQKVLRLRFGLDDGRARTLEEVGKEFNVTRERIRQIEAKALRKLRHPSRSRKLKDYLD